ncbi:MAG: exodeoxyribonuclease III [Spirochaetes bacterium]|nr:exodeoxyribonuclease III [Spirochaetota bacterium]MBN2769908.1 exodeoxyribonuclease III [Spirochaetota bacterium]
MKTVYSWNVNGIRAVQKKGFIDWINKESPDILALQETKARKEQLSEELTGIEGYSSYFISAQKAGYSGVALYTKEKPHSVEPLGVDQFDSEGRTLIASYNDFILINCYFPNSQEEGKRLDYKLDFCDAILEKCESYVNDGKNIILMGDYNIAHKPIDLKNPKTNEKNPGYLPQEREWMSKFLEHGFTDTFRHFYPDQEGCYSWWSYRFKARERNTGWRIDYHCVNNSFLDKVKKASIHADVMGSDHCPVSIQIK